ncbi:alpha/beta hydrolase [Homoserinimonas sp. OAct 916]|uniref:alpha/beta hydrolase n=1 Tax=Homoserinimonas sp. OAct 916 TaxID=2211450 RepID=UPI0018E4E21E|nr:alpha/beta hydrolase [Homoserinimonas sp. OAct 916]
MAGSLATGFVCALLLAAAPFIPATENGVTGAVLLDFGLGWAMLAVLSARFTDQPQRWAAVPALFMGAGGLLLMVFGSSARVVLDWVWPPALLVLAVWMVLRIHRQLPSRSARWLLYPLIAFLTLVAIGGSYAAVGAAVDASAYPMPGQLIDVGGHRLHLHCTGSGSPTVVLQPGGGEMSSNLGWIAPAVAQSTRVCVYDRAGRGWSEPADTRQDGTQIATELHTLLQNARVPGPYVLAGHSFGGYYTLIFAALYPDEVAGMVLVDSSDSSPAVNPGSASPGAVGSYDVLGRVAALVSIAGRFGLARLYAPVEAGSLPPRARDEVRASIATANSLRSTIDEYVQANASGQEATSMRDFGDKPLIVLTAGVGVAAAHPAAQDHLATLSANSLHRTIDGAEHEGLVATQEGASATTRAILDVVESVRSGVPLAK